MLTFHGIFDWKSFQRWGRWASNAFGYQVFDLPAEQQEASQAEFISEFEQIESSDRGSWCDATAPSVIARKQLLEISPK